MQALSAGVFLAIGLIHMLSHANHGFALLHIHYPAAFLLAGLAYMILFMLEGLALKYYQASVASQTSYAILAFFILSVHSILAGATLGIERSWSITFVLLLAILAHKWAASFALSIQIAKAPVSLWMGIALLLTFSLMTPAGILLGEVLLKRFELYPFLEPTFNALAAGSFLYLGSMHGFFQVGRAKKNHIPFQEYICLLLGFSIMAAVAIWT